VFFPFFLRIEIGELNVVRSAIDFFPVAFIVAPFAMVAGGTITATQLYKPQNIIAWGRYLSLRSGFSVANRGFVSNSAYNCRSGSDESH
jgi:hypothetical protein